MRPSAAGDGIAVTAAPAPRLRILETGYGRLVEPGGEVPGYGLYSYAILPQASARSAAFLTHIFTEVPSIEATAAIPAQVNILYVPLRKDKTTDFADLQRRLGDTPDKMAAEYATLFYDYRTARALLNHVCNPPADSIRKLCDGDLSRGPYLFTYAAPASQMDSVPPPFLFVDLSDVHEDAFAELLAAFKAQVKRDDISDEARIRTLRLQVLQIALKASDWISPVQKAIGDIVHSVTADARNPGAK
ncbi:hypothetical protein [Rhodopseudomonas palustris]|uniref:hypothetical protein n=1 Tax=Rhodopseudomonas palustris TaxID=1076 RepID=UPI0002E6B19A